MCTFRSGLVIAILIALMLPSRPASATTLSQTEQATSAGTYLWFSSIFKRKSGTFPAGDHLFATNTDIKLTFTSGGTTTTLQVPNVPDAVVTFAPSGTMATTLYNPNHNPDQWKTTVPYDFNDNIFLLGVAYLLPVSLPKNTTATWTISFSTDTPNGFEISWRVAAAAYTSLPACEVANGCDPSTETVDYNAMLVKVLHSSTMDAYHNGDQAGTPEAEKSYLVAGGSGGGGSNYTGNYSTTVNLFPTYYPVPLPEPGSLTLLALGLVGVGFTARRRYHRD